MPNGHPPGDNPTMIIPKGTEIRVGSSGQLSIRTPGNLVIQNSGQYSEIESVGGSIRIEENVSVEAVHVKAAEACYVLGSLTAWKVEARKLTLDEKARAFIMLQESQDLELAKTARLVGNFSSEKEIFLMMSRYSPQLKNLPLQVGPGDGSGQGVSPVVQRHPVEVPVAPAAATDVRSTGQSLLPPLPRVTENQPVSAAEGLRVALILLERDLRRPAYDSGSRAALQRIYLAVRDTDLEKLRGALEADFSAVIDPSDDARRARDLIISFLKSA